MHALKRQRLGYGKTLPGYLSTSVYTYHTEPDSHRLALQQRAFWRMLPPFLVYVTMGLYCTVSPRMKFHMHTLHGLRSRQSLPSRKFRILRVSDALLPSRRNELGHFVAVHCGVVAWVSSETDKDWL